MKYFKDQIGTVHAFESDGSQDAWILSGLIPMTPEEVDAHLTPLRIVPQSVTAAQGGIALIEAGLMDAVMAVVSSPELPAAHKWAWDRTTIWERSSPSLGFIAQAAGISDEQMDDLFIRAAEIRP
ncbi:hypothetical protein [Bordetella avium]|uniref:hypothetical protein n=1 Tax=Bordetella avium TaxID=521 RepID=UPI000E680ABF|nr:hypothetical protein [Bordetella avium]RIQ55313.1 hypothetical protein D0841_16475 [Bordetella avium]